MVKWNGLCVFFFYAADCGFISLVWLDAQHIKKNIESLWRVKNMPRLGSFSPRFQFDFRVFYIVIDWTLKYWCKYKWSSNRRCRAALNVPLKNLWGTWRQWKHEWQKNDTNKIGIFLGILSSLTKWENLSRGCDQWDLMIKGKFNLIKFMS